MYIWRNDNRGPDGSSERALGLVFQNRDENARRNRGIDILQHAIDAIGTSPEETVMNNAEEGGEGQIMSLANRRQNGNIGAVVSGQIRANRVANGQYYYKNFVNYGNPDPDYCAALERNDKSVCSPKDKADTDPFRIMMVKLAEPMQGGMAGWHMMNYDAGDRWFGHNWPGGMKKREQQADTEVKKKGE